MAAEARKDFPLIIATRPSPSFNALVFHVCLLWLVPEVKAKSKISFICFFKPMSLSESMLGFTAFPRI